MTENKKRKIITLAKERKRQICMIIASTQGILKEKGKVLSREEYLNVVKGVKVDGIDPIQDHEEELYAFEQYFTQYPKGARFVETASTASRKRDVASFKSSILRNAMKQADSYGHLINREIMETTLAADQSDIQQEESEETTSFGFCEISIIESEAKYPSPEKCELFLCPYHILLPINQANLDALVQGAKRIIFADIESVAMVITKADYADSLLFIMYAKTLVWTLPQNLLQLLGNKRMFFVCADSGKERADGLIDAFAVDFHHRMDKRIAFAIVSNDHGFGTTVTTIKSQGRDIARFHVAGDADGDKVFEQIVKRFP